MARGSYRPASAHKKIKGPGLFPPAMKRGEEKTHRMIEKTEESENNRYQSSRLFLCDNKGHMIFQPPFTAGRSEGFFWRLFYSKHNHGLGLLAEV